MDCVYPGCLYAYYYKFRAELVDRMKEGIHWDL